MVVATEGVARHIGLFRGSQHFGHAGVARQVVHTQRDDAQRTGHQFARTPALAAVGAHVVHLALVARLQPALQMRAVLFEVEPADADLLEAEFTAPDLDGLGEMLEVGS
ncbi:hypothetical protein D9M70_584390 [compost metagenome]